MDNLRRKSIDFIRRKSTDSQRRRSTDSTQGGGKKAAPQPLSFWPYSSGYPEGNHYGLSMYPDPSSMMTRLGVPDPAEYVPGSPLFCGQRSPSTVLR
ncbi:hypothetical protein ACOMHN_023708 [Nucella lapillus]